MYLWKCWRDTRSLFLVLVAAYVFAGLLGAYVYFDPFGWIAAKPEESRLLWGMNAQWTLATSMGIIPIAGIVLGSLGVGTEFEKRTADFLLTRPWTRRRLLWTSWGVGMAEILALSVLGLAARWFSPFPFTPPRTLRAVVGLCVVGVVLYSVTYLATTLVRNSRNGMGLSLLVFSAYIGVYAWLRYWYEIQIPMIFELLPSARQTIGMSLLMTWVLVGILATVAAQFVFERQEV